MLAYHDDPTIKSKIITQLEKHARADQIVKGQYWEHGKGCAIGCTIHGSDHSKYETKFGIPVMLARLEDTIFEGLPNGMAKAWPLRFMGAIRPGADLSRVGWKWLEWLMLVELDYIREEAVRACLAESAAVLRPLTCGEPVDRARAAEAAEAAKAAGASWASWAPGASWASWAAGASWAAAKAAKAAEAAAKAAKAAEAAAKAAKAAEAAEAAAEQSYIRMADKLIALLEAA